MASIPLPALGIKPPQDPVDNLSRLAQLKSALLQQQMIPGQIQAQQLENEQRQQQNQITAQQLKDQQATTQAMQEWDGKDINALPGLVLKHGASATAVFGLKKNIIDQQQQLATLTKDQLANQAAVSDQLLGHIDTLKGITDPVQRAQAAKDQASQILSSPLAKMLDPQTGQMLQGMAAGQFVPNDDQLSLFEKGLTSHSKQIEETLKAQQGAEANAKAAEANANAQKVQAQLAYYQKNGLAPGIPIDVQEAQDWLAKNPGKGPADFLKYKSTLIPAFNFNLQNAGAKAGSPDLENAAQLVANGKAKIGDVITYRTPLSQRLAFLSRVTELNPNYNAGDFDITKGVKREFTIGKVSQELNAYNTALAHADLLQQAAKAMQNGDTKVLNSLQNRLKTEFGSSDVTNFNVIANAYTREVTKALSSGHLTDAEIKEQGATIPSNASPEQIMGAITAYKNLMASKLQQRKNQYDQGQKAQPNFGGGQQGGASGAFTVTAPNGKTYSFKDQASADAFKAKIQ